MATLFLPELCLLFCLHCNSQENGLHQKMANYAADLESGPWLDKSSRVANKNDITDATRRVSAHAFLYCKSSAILFGRINMKYGIMMLLRFDGTIGFPGGFVDKSESIIDGLNRELHEEIGLNEKFYFDEENYFFSWINQKCVDHFYVKEYPETDFISIENDVLKAKDWGGETLGILRVPVHKLHKKAANQGPLPTFLKQRFISSAREQLIEGMINQNIITRDYMMRTWSFV